VSCSSLQSSILKDVNNVRTRDIRNKKMVHIFLNF